MRTPLGRIGAALLVFVAISTPHAASWTVQPDGGGDAPHLQAAIDSCAAAGDWILLADGSFIGHGNRELIVTDKSIVFRSTSGDPLRCVIDCQGSPDLP